MEFVNRHLAAAGYIGPGDDALFHHTHDVHAAVDHIKGFYRRFHSLRFVDEKAVIRMSDGLEPARLDALRAEFADILVAGGSMRLSVALPKECDEPELAGLARLVVDFNKRDFARLRRFIDAVNRI
jgi:hypothetical protein